MSSKKVIGIDLGTGFSCVSVIENGKPVVIANSEGQRTTPSVVLIKNGERTVGGPAKRQMVMNPKNTISFIKRFMGSDWNDEDVQKMIKMVSYDVVEKSGKPNILIDGRQYTPEEISSYILTSMKKTAEDYYGEEVKDCVITCPAWFNDEQRRATKVAGEIAGLNVLRIINEPTAAVLASDIKVEKDKDMTVMAFDFGSGTCDISIIEISNLDGEMMFEVKSSNGDVFLGGQNFDNKIVDWLVDEFKKEHNGFDLSKDSMAYSRLIDAAEKAKCELSFSATTDINLPYITVIDNIPQMINKTLTKSKFEQLTQDLVDKSINLAQKALELANKSYKDLDKILLVGGSTRIPAVQDALSKTFNVPLDKSVNPDEAVSLGAATQANIIVGGDTENNMILLDVTPLSLGIETMGGVMTKLVDANTTIPTTKTETFSTAVDNQSSVEIVVLQGERPMAKDNKTIGRFHLDGIMPAPKGVPQIDVSFEIDVNGILSVSAKDKATGKEQSIKIESGSGLTDEDIQRMKSEAEANAEKDKKELENVRVMNLVESTIYQTEKQMKELDEKLTSEQKTNLENDLTALKGAFEQKDVDACKTCMENLTKTWNEISKVLYGQNQQNGTNVNSSPFDFTNMTGNNPK